MCSAICALSSTYPLVWAFGDLVGASIAICWLLGNWYASKSTYTGITRMWTRIELSASANRMYGRWCAASSPPRLSLAPRYLVSVVQGFCFVDRLSWDNYNESGDLKGQIETFKNRFGHYPSSVHADKLYRNRGNIQYCKDLGIRLSGPALGRPKSDSKALWAKMKQQHQDEADRVEIEGKFGVGKRKYSLSRILEKLPLTSATAIL